MKERIRQEMNLPDSFLWNRKMFAMAVRGLSKYFFGSITFFDKKCKISFLYCVALTAIQKGD